jgi:(S)-ureidoglycine-glyoxylate aminotransferase
MAGGGPSTPDDRVLLALTTPLIGQFDPAFTAIMDEVMQLAREVLLTRNRRCYAVSGLPSAGVEALLNTLPEGRYTVVRHVDPATGSVTALPGLARRVHGEGGYLIVDATYSLGAIELRTDEWRLDAVVAGVDYGIGAPSGMTLITYSEELERRMTSRAEPPKTSYLDLLQLQAYWSPERLNHHTAPTSLVYGLREALRLLVDEGLAASWHRHATVARALRAGLQALGLSVAGDGPLLIVPGDNAVRARLREQYGVHVGQAENGRWRIALFGADATLEAGHQVLAALRALSSE